MADKIPDNVANPEIYRKAKAKARAKFDVYPSAYANGWMVQEYQRMGGKYKGAKNKAGGGDVSLDPKKSDLNKDGKLSKYERRRGEAIARNMKFGGSVEMQPRGCGAMLQSKRKTVRVPRG